MVRLDRIAEILAEAVLMKLKKDLPEGRQRGSRLSGADREDKPSKDTERTGGNP
jgi:hypothetical protein